MEYGCRYCELVSGSKREMHSHFRIEHNKKFQEIMDYEILRQKFKTNHEKEKSNFSPFIPMQVYGGKK